MVSAPAAGRTALASPRLQQAEAAHPPAVPVCRCCGSPEPVGLDRVRSLRFSSADPFRSEDAPSPASGDSAGQQFDTWPVRAMEPELFVPCGFDGDAPGLTFRSVLAGPPATFSASGLLRGSSLEGAPARPTDTAMQSASALHGNTEATSSRRRESRCDFVPRWTTVTCISADSVSGARWLPYWHYVAGLTWAAPLPIRRCVPD